MEMTEVLARMEVLVKLLGRETRKGNLLQASISDLEDFIRSKAINALKANNLKTLGDIAFKSKKELLKIKGFGKKDLLMAREYLDCYGISIPYWN